MHKTCLAVYRSKSLCFAVRCSLLQCAAVCCSARVYQTRGAHTKSAKLPVFITIVLQSAREEGGVESGKKGESVGERGGESGEKRGREVRGERGGDAR